MIRLSKWDKRITALILCISIFSLVLMNVFAFSAAPDTVIIELDGKEYAKYRLGEINSSKSIEIKTNYGYNKIEIFSDGARVAEADCPDQLDVAQGKITKANEYIVCLPHRLVVRLAGGGGGADAVAY